MKNPRLVELLASLGDTSRAALCAAFEEGVRVGIERGMEQARERMLKALPTREEQSHANGTAPSGAVQTSLPSYAKLGRQMLAENPTSTYGVTEGIAYFRTHHNVEVSCHQMRYLLKALEHAGWAERLQPGKYRAGPRLKQDATGEAPSGAAESARH